MNGGVGKRKRCDSSCAVARADPWSFSVLISPPSGAGSRRVLFIHRLPVDRRLDRGNLLSKCRLHAEVEWVIVVQCPFAEKKGLSLFRVSCLGYKKR